MSKFFDKSMGWFIGFMDRLSSIFLVVLSELIFMYIGVHTATSILLATFPCILDYVNPQLLSITTNDTLITIVFDMAITTAIYLIIYSKLVFDRLIYILTGRKK